VLALRLRLQMHAPLVHPWPQALALQALPPTAPPLSHESPPWTKHQPSWRVSSHAPSSW
jgi:hypothetical protein